MEMINKKAILGNINETIVEFPTAKLAKEKGFTEPCYEAYHHANPSTSFLLTPRRTLPFSSNINETHNYDAPTQSQLSDWLRKIYHIYVRVASNSLTSHFPMIEILTVDGAKMMGPPYTKNYKTYEEAMEVGLMEALKLINIEK